MKANDLYPICFFATLAILEGGMKVLDVKTKDKTPRKLLKHGEELQ